MRKKIIEFLANHPNFAYKYGNFLSDLSVEEWENIIISQPVLKREALKHLNGAVLFAEEFSDSQLARFGFEHWDILIKRNKLREKAKKFPAGVFALFVNGLGGAMPPEYFEISPKGWFRILSAGRNSEILKRNPQIIAMCECWAEMDNFCDKIVPVHPELWIKFRKSSIEKILEDYRNFEKSKSVNRFTREEWFKIIETWPNLATKCPREIFLHFDKFQWNKLSKAQSASISDMYLKSMLFKL